MDSDARVQAIIAADPLRWRILGRIRELQLPDCWVGAGFVRNAVWDHLHGRTTSLLAGDVDVLWFDQKRADHRDDRQIEARLRTLSPDIEWSVKNQARMHVRNDDPSYASVADAMRHWPETATAVAVRRDREDRCEVLAPFGVDDLLGLVLRPTPRFVDDKRQVFADRIKAKHWLTTWPLLRIEPT